MLTADTRSAGPFPIRWINPIEQRSAAIAIARRAIASAALVKRERPPRLRAESDRVADLTAPEIPGERTEVFLKRGRVYVKRTALRANRTHWFEAGFIV
jgi:hypothetical protein